MPIRIIYLDDEPQLCEMFVDNFASDEISVKTFTDPGTAILAINESPPDLVLIDFRLPQTNGNEVAERLNPKIPKVLLTGDLDITHQENFVRIFHKPFDFDEMEDFISTYLEQKKYT